MKFSISRKNAQVSSEQKRTIARASRFGLRTRRGVNVNQVVMAVVALVVVGSIAGIGITSINNANTTGWTTEQVLLFGLIATFFVIGLLVSFIPKMGKK